ncbi:MAG: N-6 DNA methylase [Candidatus Lokiarchaeota archaeon]|nr:N-6 DNA methylase [Candidatus Lokiarchaeota archaeon]
MRGALNKFVIDYIPILKEFYRDKILQEHNKKKRKHTNIAIVLEWLNFKGISPKDKRFWSEIYGKEAAFNLINRLLFLKIYRYINKDLSIIADKLRETPPSMGETENDVESESDYRSLLVEVFQDIRKLRKRKTEKSNYGSLNRRSLNRGSLNYGTLNYGSIFNANLFDLYLPPEEIVKDLLLNLNVIDFEKIGANALKNIYETQISQEERKKLGQYYTPDYIIYLILYSIPTILNFNSDKNLKILDPACGSGGFLIEVYNILKKKFLESGMEINQIHEILLTKMLFGIDIEPFAVQLAAINLLMKDIETPINYINITQCNLLSMDALDKFDVVIGNPPYFLISNQEKANSARNTGKMFHTTYLENTLIEKYRKQYDSWPHDNRNPNIFYIFLEKSIELLGNGGYLGFIIPDILLAGESTKNLRKYILETCKIKKIFIIDGKVFKGGNISNIILILEKTASKVERKNNWVEIINTSTFELKKNHKSNTYNEFISKPHKVKQEIFYHNTSNVFSVKMTEHTSPIFLNLYKKINQHKLVTLGEIVNIHRGIENIKKNECLTTNEYISRNTGLRKLIAVDNISKYQINWNRSSFNTKYVNYSTSNREQNADINFKREAWFTQRKIMLKRVSNQLIAALEPEQADKRDYFFTLDSIQMIWLKREYRHQYDPRILIAILNSQLMNFFYQTLFSYKKLFARVQKTFLKQLPIPKKIDKKMQSRISNIVKKLENDNSNQDNLQKDLDELIYSLYFSEEELKKFSPYLKPHYNIRDVPGIGILTYFKLAEHGITTLEGLIKCNPRTIADRIYGIGEKSLRKWKIKAEKMVKLLD